MTIALRRWAALAAVAALVGCGSGDLNRPPPEIGDVALGYTIVVAKNAQKAGPSRNAEPEEWEAALRDAVVARVGRQDGEKLYHLGIGVDAYALAVPGIPVVLNPKSVLALSVTLWDDTAQMKVNEEPERLTVFEDLSPETMISSGLTQTREAQIANLSAAAALAIERWLAKNKDWFSAEAVAGRALRAELVAQTGGPAADVAPQTAAPAADALFLPGAFLPEMAEEDDPAN